GGDAAPEDREHGGGADFARAETGKRDRYGRGDEDRGRDEKRVEEREIEPDGSQAEPERARGHERDACPKEHDAHEQPRPLAAESAPGHPRIRGTPQRAA